MQSGLLMAIKRETSSLGMSGELSMSPCHLKPIISMLVVSLGIVVCPRRLTDGL